MGVGPFNRHKKDNKDRPSVAVNGNPDPYRFNIISYTRYGDYLIVAINYPDANNFEGNKVLLYKGVTIKDLESLKFIDPHFSDDPKVVSPIARFSLNGGWELATKLVLTLNENRE